MEDPNPSSSSPSFRNRRDQVSSHRTRPVPPGEPAEDTGAKPGEEQVTGEPTPAETPGPIPVETGGSSPFFSEVPPPLVDAPADPEPAPAAEDQPPNDAPAPEYALSGEAPAVAADAPAETPADNLPGDGANYPNATIIRPPAPPAPAARPRRTISPRSGFFAVLAIAWLAGWGGTMWRVLDHQFDRSFDWNTSYFSVAARNLVREGFVEMRGGVYITAGEGFGTTREFYAGHPPMTAWLLSGWMKIFGTEDRAIRSMPLAFTALSLLLLFVLVARVFGAGPGLATMAVCSMLPMTAFYAQNVNMEPLVMAFMLLAAHGYLSWSRSRSRPGLVIMMLAVVFGCWTDWPMYLFAGLLALAHFVHRREALPLPADHSPEDELEQEHPRRPIFTPLFLILLPLATFALYLLYLRINNSGVNELLERAKDRVSGAPGVQGGWFEGAQALFGRFGKAFQHDKTAIAFLKTWLVEVFTLPALFLFVIGVVFWPRWSRTLAGGNTPLRRALFRVLFCMLMTQLAYSIAFPNGAMVHDFWQYYLIVPVAVCAGGLCVWLTLGGPERRGFFAGLFDRGAWAIYVLIPLAAVGPLTWRLHVGLIPGRAVPVEGKDLNLDLEEPLDKYTLPTDVLLTDLTQEQMKFALPWYADRRIIVNDGSEESTVKEAGIVKAIKDLEKEHQERAARQPAVASTSPSATKALSPATAPAAPFRLLYIYRGANPEVGKYLDPLYPRRVELTPAAGTTPATVLFLIRGAPLPSWSATRPATLPARATATAPASRPTTRP